MVRSRFLLGAAVALLSITAACASAPPPAPEAASEPGMLVVSKGRFTMGRDQGELNEQPAHLVELSTFAMDRTEVSAVEFAEFLNARGNPDERYFTPNDQATVVMSTGTGTEATDPPRFAARAGYERYPANNVSWSGADAYCRWRGRRLPTEAEWEKAARGADKRLYPWGKQAPLPNRARFAQSWQERQLEVLVPVDALPDGTSPYGLLNMAGNVLEWVSDWYRQNLCDFCNPDGERNLWLIELITGEGERAAAVDEPASALASSETATAQQSAPASQRQVPPRQDPPGPVTGSFKVLRGGSWENRHPGELTSTRRFWLDPTQRFAHTGFRCAQSAAQKEAAAQP